VAAAAPRTTDVLERSRPGPAQRSQYRWNERHQIGNTIRRRIDDNDPEREGAHVLLVLQIAIHRDEGIDGTASACQRRAIVRARPAAAVNGGHGMGR
jgi:hypothetical protein